MYPQSSVPSPAEPIQRTTRLAPSPTGALHLGNAFAFLANWALARNYDWHIHLRIEDLDTPRVKPGVIDQTIETLGWIGLDWDTGPEVQSLDQSPYVLAMKKLARSGRVYPCPLTRTEIESAASAPNEGTHETRFDPALRPLTIPRAFDTRDSNWRLIVDEASTIEFDDQFAGPQRIDIDQTIGDFVVWTKRGSPSYQLAVVVDDAACSITDIVRGDDLIDSAGRQILLMRALGIDHIPSYTHLPLVRGADGRRLAKRHGDTRLDTYRARGVTPERIIGLIAFWCKILPTRQPLSIEEFRAGFGLDTLPHHDFVFTPEDDRWLMES